MILSKKNIAIRHTNQAIKMFFKKEDSVSIHLLVCAANEILIALLKKGKKPILFGKNGILQKLYINDNYFYDINRKRVEAYNFFKHADRDTEEKYKFNSDLNWLFLFENLIMIKQLNMHFSKEMAYFYCWLIFTKKRLFKKNNKNDNFIEDLKFNKEDYIDLYDDIINQIKTDFIRQIEKNLEANIKSIS